MLKHTGATTTRAMPIQKECHARLWTGRVLPVRPSAARVRLYACESASKKNNTPAPLWCSRVRKPLPLVHNIKKTIPNAMSQHVRDNKKQSALALNIAKRMACTLSNAPRRRGPIKGWTADQMDLLLRVVTCCVDFLWCSLYR